MRQVATVLLGIVLVAGAAYGLSLTIPLPNHAFRYFSISHHVPFGLQVLGAAVVILSFAGSAGMIVVALGGLGMIISPNMAVTDTSGQAKTSLTLSVISIVTGTVVTIAAIGATAFFLVMIDVVFTTLHISSQSSPAASVIAVLASLVCAGAAAFSLVVGGGGVIKIASAWRQAPVC